MIFEITKGLSEVVVSPRRERLTISSKYESMAFKN